MWRRKLARFDRLEFDHEPEGGIPAADPAGGAPEASQDQVAWMRKADDHRRRGLHENSLRYYSRALELDKSLVAGWLGQVQMLVLLGEYPEAELWARKALELFKGHGDLMAARAQALARIGDRTQAMELADAALRQEGNSAYRWMVRGELLVMARDDVDRHCFDKAVGARPRLARSPRDRTDLLASRAGEQGPICGLARPSRWRLQSFYAWFVQGQCEQALGFDRQAENSYRRVLELSPRHVDANRKLAELANQAWSLSKGLRRLIGRA